MLNFHNYTYRDKPSSKTRLFEVHPLAIKGHDEYLSKDSEVHLYLHKLKPSVLVDIYKKPTTDEQTIETQTQTIEEIKPEEIINYENRKENSQKIQNRSFEGVRQPQQNYSNQTGFTNKNNNNFSATFSKGFYNNKTNNQNSKEVFTKICKKKAIPNETRYKREYLHDVDLFNKRNASTANGFYRPKRYDGFESFNVPRIIPAEKADFRSTKIYEDKIAKTIYLENKEISLDEENERLKMIFKTQTDRAFLRTANLPNIKTIIDQPKINLKKTGTGTKLMGMKYNPYNFDSNGKNRTKRNPYGALFQF